MSSSPSPPKIYIHPLTSAHPSNPPSSPPPPPPSHTISQALLLLRPHLPVSLPLYRRLQSGRFFESTVLMTNLENLSSSPSPSPLAGKGPNSEWMMAFVDRTCRPETELWMYCSWEGEGGKATMTTTTTTSSNVKGEDEDDGMSGGGEEEEEEEEEKELQRQTALMTSLAREIDRLPLPESIHADVIPGLKAEGRGQQGQSGENDDDEQGDTAGITRTAYGGHASDPKVLLCGAVHRRSIPALQRSGLVTERFKVGLIDNHTYIFHVDRLPEVRPLPEGLRWGKLGKENFALVRARTQVPRLDRTLGALRNTAVFDGQGRAVAWAFVGLDGSLTSLHVEPEWRGKGMAKAVTKRLFENEMEGFWEEGSERLAHGYVQVGNEASCRVCDSLGGKSNWEVIWVRLDLGILNS